MPTFEIEQFELHVSKYRVAADSKAEAISKLLAGVASPVEQTQEFVEVANNYGLPTNEFPDLARELEKLGVIGIDDGVIPSIRSIEED